MVNDIFVNKEKRGEDDTTFIGANKKSISLVATLV